MQYNIDNINHILRCYDWKNLIKQILKLFIIDAQLVFWMRKEILNFNVI